MLPSGFGLALLRYYLATHSYLPATFAFSPTTPSVTLAMAATLRARIRPLWHPLSRRTFYSKRAEFTILNASGIPTTEKVDVWLGDSHEAYVIVPPHVSKAIKAASGKLTLANGLDKYPLIFDHNKRQFSCSRSSTSSSADLAYFIILESEPFPQLVIPQDLLSSAGKKISPATLFYFESTPTHNIALDGTPDCMTLNLDKYSLAYTQQMNSQSYQDKVTAR